MVQKRSGSEKTKAQDETQDDFYVGISEPLEVRRTVLETSKCIIQAMHRYEKYKEYREQKIDLFKKLNKQMGELGGLITTIKSALPKSTLRIKKAREEILASRAKAVESISNKIQQKEESVEFKAKQIRTPEVIKALPKKELSELEKLELELSQIESKLSSLSK
jgi:hypothetical protein